MGSQPTADGTEENAVSERFIDDADWATAAEQSSEDDEAQEGQEEDDERELGEQGLFRVHSGISPSATAPR